MRLAVDQVGIVVTDLEESIDRYAATFGLGDWRIWTYEQKMFSASSFRGGPATYSMRLALSGDGPQVELIEPLAGPSLYHEWLAESAGGVHHLGSRVESLDEAMEALGAKGWEMIQMGRGYGADGDGGFAYFDTRGEHGMILEVIEVPRQRVEPEATVA
jgi:catechol 2,3-dioxygenase-like lactoylglutathione lyase family enzyme